MLPIGVMMPTLDSMALLPGHIEKAVAWLDKVEQVVVVDSFSKDGTVEFIRENLRHPNLRIVSHPRGLYESWNHGIAQLETKFTYISTVGDTITAGGLEHLATTAEGLQCDVLVSPPEFIRAHDGPAPPREWPIHQMIAELHISRPQMLHRLTVFLYACLHTFGPHFSSLLGSSASNLYRTSVLKKFPFPLDCGRSGDTGWSFLHSLEIALGVTPVVCSTFVSHPKPRDPGADFYSRLAERYLAFAQPMLERELARDPAAKAACSGFPLDGFFDSIRAMRRDHVTLCECREKRLPWFLNPRAWIARGRRSRNQNRIDAFKKFFPNA